MLIKEINKSLYALKKEIKSFKVKDKMIIFYHHNGDIGSLSTSKEDKFKTSFWFTKESQKHIKIYDNKRNK